MFIVCPLNIVATCAGVKSDGVVAVPLLLPFMVDAPISFNFAFVTTVFAIVVVFPTEVTSPDKFAFVVTVAALPPMFIV